MTNHDIVSLDFYNSHYYIRLNGLEYYSDDLEKFISEINYPYTTTKLLAYEPSRAIYQVERDNGISDSGPTLEEVCWFVDNKAHLEFVLRNIEQANTPVITLEMERNNRFANTDWLLQRHQEEILLMTTPTLTNTQFSALLSYRQQLRDLTNTYAKDTETNAIVWPTNPFN